MIILKLVNINIMNINNFKLDYKINIYINKINNNYN